MQDIDADISTEWERGLDNLSLRYAHLFSGSLLKCLKLPPHDKQRWLTSVWSARDAVNGGIQVYDRTSQLHYDKWKAKKRQVPLLTIGISKCRTKSKSNLTIITAQPLEDEASLSDDDSIPGLGTTPRASYEFAQDAPPTEITKQQSSSPTLRLLPLDTSSSLQGPSSTRSLQHSSPAISDGLLLLRSTIAVSDTAYTFIQDFLSQNLPEYRIIAQFNHQQVTLHSLRTTAPQKWINDKVINFYLSILNHYDLTQKEETGQPRHHYFNSFFLTQLLDEG